MTRNRFASIPALSPLFFTQVFIPDYNLSFPIPDTIFSSQEYFRGVKKFPYCQKWLTDKELTFQLWRIGSITMQVYNVYTKTLTTLTGNETDITPTSWTEPFDVFNYTWTPTAKGLYKIFFQVTYGLETEYYESEYIRVRDSLDECIELVYQHSVNDYGLVFTQNGTTQDFVGILYVEGNLIDNASKADNSGYINDRGTPKTLRSTPEVIYDIQFSPLPQYFIQKLMNLFCCDTVYINGMNIGKIAQLEKEQLQESSAYAMTQKVQLVDYDYHYQESPGNQVFLSNDFDDFISNNSDILITP